MGKEGEGTFIGGFRRGGFGGFWEFLIWEFFFVSVYFSGGIGFFEIGGFLERVVVFIFGG